MECKDCDFYKEVGPGWVCTDEEDWRNNGDPCCRYHPNASLTLFEGVTKEAHDKLKADYAALAEENRRLREALDRVRAALAAWEDAAPECVQDIRRALEEGSDGRYNQ